MTVTAVLVSALNVMPCHWLCAGWVAAPSPLLSPPNASSFIEVKTIRLSGLPLATSAPSTAITTPVGSKRYAPSLSVIPGLMVHVPPLAIVMLPAGAYGMLVSDPGPSVRLARRTGWLMVSPSSPTTPYLFPDQVRCRKLGSESSDIV